MNQYEPQSALQRYVVDARQKLETMDWLVQGVGGSDAAPSFSGYPDYRVETYDSISVDNCSMFMF